MFFSKFSTTAAVLALVASHGLAEPLRPYQPIQPRDAVVKMSVNRIFGLRDNMMPGYAPKDESCSGVGGTCDTACGPTFQVCASTDNTVHCFDPSVKQSCCTGGSGAACDDGYFCTTDAHGGPWCCPNGMSLEQCAVAYHLPSNELSSAVASTTTTYPAPALPITSETAAPVVGMPDATYPVSPIDIPATTTSIAEPVQGASTTYPIVPIVLPVTSENADPIGAEPTNGCGIPPPPPPPAEPVTTETRLRTNTRTSTIFMPAPTITRRPSAGFPTVPSLPTSTIIFAGAPSYRSQQGSAGIAAAVVAGLAAGLVAFMV